MPRDGAGQVPNLKKLDSEDRVQSINHCGDTYKVATPCKSLIMLGTVLQLCDIEWRVIWRHIIDLTLAPTTKPESG